MSPQDVDRHSFRDLHVMMEAEVKSRTEKERSEWMRSITMASATLSGLSDKGKALRSLADQIQSGSTSAGKAAPSNVRERIKRAREDIQASLRRKNEHSSET